MSWAAGSLLVASRLRRLARPSGVSDQEACASVPGDEVIPYPMLEWNRGITVAAPAEAIWPWLVQMGYGRGGWYTPEAFDRWMHRWVWRLEQTYPFQPSPWPILPEYQQLAVGTSSPTVAVPGVPLGAGGRAGAAPGLLLAASSLRDKPVDPPDAAALRVREEKLRAGGLYLEFSWAFVLLVDGNRTRLLLRARNNVAPPDGWPGCWDVPVGGWWTSTRAAACFRVSGPARPDLPDLEWGCAERRGVEADDVDHSELLLNLIKVAKRHLRPGDARPPATGPSRSSSWPMKPPAGTVPAAWV